MAKNLPHEILQITNDTFDYLHSLFNKIWKSIDTALVLFLLCYKGIDNALISRQILEKMSHLSQGYYRPPNAEVRNLKHIFGRGVNRILIFLNSLPHPPPK